MEAPQHSLRFYLWFYLPLAALGFLWLSGTLGTNAILLLRKDSLAAFAAFTLAMGIMAPIQAVFVFIPQMSTVMARGPQSRRATWLFIGTLNSAVIGGLWLLFMSPIGLQTLQLCYRMDGDILHTVRWYLLWLLPIQILEALGRWAMGQLLLSGRSLLHTILQALGLAGQLAVLGGGFMLGYEPMPVIIVSMVVNALISQGITLLAYYFLSKPNNDGAIPEVVPDWPMMMRFFTPLAVTSLCFAGGKMMMLMFLTRSSASSATQEVAVFGLLMTLNMLFNAPINQLRHVYTSYGDHDLKQVRRFNALMSSAIIAICFAVACTPVIRWFFHFVQGANGEVLDLAVAAAPIIALFPIAIAFRSDAQGRAMLQRRTGIMAKAGVIRLIALIILTYPLLHWDLLGHRSAAFILALGFAIESLVLWLGVKSHTNTLRLKQLATSTQPL